MTYTTHKKRQLYIDLEIAPQETHCAADAGVKIAAAYEKHTGAIRTPGMVLTLGQRILKQKTLSLPMKNKHGDEVGTLRVTLRQPLSLMTKRYLSQPRMITNLQIKSNINPFKQLITFMAILRTLPNLFLGLFSQERKNVKPEYIGMRLLDQSPYKGNGNLGEQEVFTETALGNLR